MNAYTFRMLMVQGYQQEDVIHNQNLNLLARWTPFICGCLGTLGLFLGSPSYFWVLGFLTLLGAIGSRSFYDYLYQVFVRPLAGLGDMPFHGAPRRFGCAVGASLFLLSGTGFYVQRPLLSFLPALIIIPLAFVAAITQWCFASSLYRILFAREANCC